ncbi:hypothetical protein MTO96_031325 [Rhipicephalus appendiculatus]
MAAPAQQPVYAAGTCQRSGTCKRSGNLPTQRDLPPQREPANAAEANRQLGYNDRYAAQVRGNPPLPSPPANNTDDGADPLKMILLFVVLLVACGVAVYMISASTKDDEDIDDSGPPKSHKQKAVIPPKLVCVMRSTPTYDENGEVAYSACDYVVYYAKSDSFDSHVPEDIRGVKIIVGIDAEDASLGDHEHNGQDGAKYYEKLASWLGKKYAVMDLNLARDFSNAAAAGQKVRTTLEKIKKQRDAPELAVLGVVIAAKDEDATRENGEKLDNIAKGALIIFQAHISSSRVASGRCEMRLNEVVITKKNYVKLAEGISGPVALSTTVAVVQFEPSDPSKTTSADKCNGYEILDRNDYVCGAVTGLMSDSGRNVENGIVYVYNTNASAQALFVPNQTHPTASWKFNVAFFDIDRYFPDNDKKCPTLRLANFDREEPPKAT